MARSKNNRSRASNQTQNQPTTHIKQHCRCVKCVTIQNLDGKNFSAPASLGHRNPQDVIDSISYYWRMLPTDAKHFLQQSPSQLNLRKFVDFWSEPQRIDNARGSYASSISGSCWILALNYLFLDKLVEAQSLILHGSFMQECVYRPIEDIATLCNATDDPVDETLTIYRDAFLATTKQSMESFLHKALPPDYRRRMSFAGKAKGHSIVGDYVNFISNDWNGVSSSTAVAFRRQPKVADKAFIEVVLINSDTNEQSTVTFGMSTTLKLVFNNFADEQGVSLRSLRFTHDGKLLFLSSVGNKTAEQLGIKHLDTIHVSSTTYSTQVVPSPPKKNSTGESTSRANLKSRGKGRRKKCTPVSPGTGNSSDNHEQDKIRHSVLLSRVFEEAQSILKSIRQRLNSLCIQRTLPKQKRSSRTKSKAAVAPMPNPSTAGISAGKAGKTQFVVQVGESCNLYKTTKRVARSLQQQQLVVTDLHGMTKEEALFKLDSSLPQWTETAMEGSYPFVIGVKIICGSGSQVLSEAVANWVRQNASVSNAPKNFYGA
ncbi:hypothetical protein ACHAXR_002206 [Thalassiosira sp. AJA248-18]